MWVYKNGKICDIDSDIENGDLKSKNKNFTSIKDLFQQKNIDINKIVVSNKVFLVKKVLNISLATKMPKN